MSPIPGHRVVPDGWAARHRPVVAGFFCDLVTVERKTGKKITTDQLGTTDDEWEPLTPTPVPALVQVNHSTMVDERDSAGHPIVVADYYARLDVEWLPDPGDRLTVTASPDPANLGVYVVRRRESQGHVVDRTVHLERVASLP